MRNLKRALSLALASVMLLGMMVVGTSAASYPDVDENDNVEAIEVLNAVNVMIGDRGNFRPDAAVNRHEMATIMAKLVLGVETADNYVGTHPFTDVFPWADKYVAACYENGLVAGTSATTFGGNQPLTAVQAAAMMLRALGYKDLSVGAKDWRAPVTAMANQIRLFDGVASNPSEQLTRNQVAQLALNTLKSPMVNLKDNTISWSNDEGQIIMTGGSREYIALSSNEAYAKAINDTEKAGTSASQIAGFTVELGEHLYNGKLKLNNNYLDVFGRPARHWEFDGKEIGSYIKEELMVMDNVGKVTGNDLYSLLGASTIKDYDTLVTIDGVANDRSDAKDILGYPNGAYFDEADMNRNNKAAVGATGTGVLTQVFVDHEKDEVYVAVINTYLARADRDYDDKSEEATLTVYGIDEYRTEKEYVKLKGSSETMKVQAEDFTGLETIKKDDPFLVTVADGEIQTMAEDEVLEGVTLTAFKKGDHVVSNGTEYAYTTTATYDSATLDNYTGIDGKTNLKDISYNIYLDAYGNLIGIKEIDAVKNYVFLAGIDVDGSNLYSKTATANALFLDGTTKTIKINLSKSKFPTHRALNNTNVVISGDALLNTWCTYTVGSDNVYTVTEAYATRVNDDHPSFKDINANPNNYPGGGDNKTKLAQSWQPAAGLKEDNYTVDVKRMRLHGTTNNSDGSKYANVYGDSTSVYLTATLDELFNDSTELNVDKTVTPVKPWSYGIIKDVDAVTTGVADVSIKVLEEEDARETANKNGDIDDQYPGATAFGIYTLYDSDGIVIASVVVGEDDGAKDLVYVHTDTLDLESYNSTDDIWTWTRRVVFNGQETTLTEKDSELSELKEMLQFHWYEIKRNADGNVISVVPAYRALYNADTEKNAFVHEYEMINTTVEATSKDTVLYQTQDGPLPADDNGAVTGHKHDGFYTQKLNVIGTNTLAVETLFGSGIHFRDNVNVVLQYWNRNTEQTEIETGTGVDRLKSMVDFVNKNTETRDSAHPYYLSAVIEKGFATTIVIYDSFNSYNRPDAPAGNYELTLGGVLNSIYTTPANLNSDVYIVNSDNSISYVESNDDVATSTVNGYKRYTVPYGAKIRVYDNDVADDFQPFFSPIKPLSDYGYKPEPTAKRAYFEFTVPVSIRLENDKLTIRERLTTDPVYVGIDSEAEATVTIGGTTYKPGQSFTVTPGQTITVVPTTAGDKVYVNGELLGADGKYKVQPTDTELVITTKPGGVTPPDPDKKYYTVTFTENGSAEVKNFTTDVAEKYEENTAVEITITANEGYELVSVGGEAAEAGAKTATWSTEKITANVTVEVVTKKTETTKPSTDLTVTSGVEADVAADQIGKALTLTVKGGASNKWYIVTGTDVPEYSCAQADVNGDVMFTYTPSGDKVTITLTETKFMTNPLTGAPCLFGEVSEGQYGMIDYTKLTISGMKSRAAVGDTSGNMEGALVAITIGEEKVYFVNTYVNDKLSLVLTDLDADTVKKLNDAIQKADPDPDTGLVSVTPVQEKITTDGAANVTEDENGKSVINFDLGVPKAKGVKLPTEVTIDGKVTAKVKWYYNGAAIDPDTGDIFAWEDNLNGYRYEILEPTEVAEGSLSFPVKVVYPNDPADSEEIASNDDLKKVVVVWNDVKPDQKPAEDPSKLTDWELVGTEYTFSYHTEANRPSVHDIEKVIKQDQSAYAVEVDLTGNSGTADVTKTEGATAIANAFTVVLKPKTAVILNDNDSKPVCWLDKADRAQALEGVKAGTVLIASSGRDITIGTPVTLSSVNPASYKINDNTDLPDYLYVYTAIPVATLASDDDPFFQVTFKGWEGMSAEDKEDAAISALLTSGDFAVRPGTELQIEGTVPGDGKTYELQINGKYVEGISSRKSGVVSSDKCNYGTVTIDDSVVAGKTEDGATKGTVTFREAGEVITVKLGEDSYYVVTGKDLKIEGLTAGKSYIQKELTAATAKTVDSYGVLNLTTVTDNQDGKLDDVITLHEAYAFTQDATVIEDGTSTGDSNVHTAKVVKAGKELVTPVTASSDEKALAYVEVGATVYLWAKDANKSLVSETLGDKLVPVPSKNATINSGNRYCYSFEMPAERVVDIKADVGMTITPDANVKNLLAASGKHVITVTLSDAVEGAELVIPADPWTNVSGELKGSVPTGMNEKIGVKETTSGKVWTITLTADTNGEGVTPGTYYLKFTVNGVDVIQTITVDPPTAVDTITVDNEPTKEAIVYGYGLPTNVKAYGTQLKAATADAATTACTWTWRADGVAESTDPAVTKVIKAGKYTVWIPAEPAVGKTFTGAQWATTDALKINTDMVGKYDAAKKVIGYTYDFALPTITVEQTAGTPATEKNFTAGTAQDGIPVEGAAAVDMSTGTGKINDAGVTAIQSITNLGVGGVTVDLSTIDITADTSTMADVLAAIQAAVDDAVSDAITTGEAGSVDYTKVTDVTVAANDTTGFKVTFKTTLMTHHAAAVAVAPKTDVTFDAALTGADVNGVVITVDGKKFEFVVTGDVVGAGNTKVQVAAGADKDAIATAFAGAVNTAATGMDHVSAASASGAKVTITGVDGETDEIVVRLAYAEPAAQA